MPKMNDMAKMDLNPQPLQKSPKTRTYTKVP